MTELLSPVGDFECLKAAVQNGADAVYFGASLFSARAFASNFDDELLEQAITYAKIHGVKTNLTLNTLIKNNELADAINLAKKAYEFGIDAIIVQDLGLARFLIKNFPGLHVHGSTQMTVHNLNGVLKLQELGFSRVVLSRELNIKEIENICKNSNIEIETFVHGALCISYSGQCLFSSMVGGRSGNRGKCAQPCRLPYELLENTNLIDKGYLLSPRDLCGLEFLPQLVNAGVSCLKIEGRMKTPEYVAVVTRIYRKYLDIINNKKDFIIDEQDKKELLQVFNRGGFSTGHLSTDSNKKLIYPQKSNNMGIYLGKISHFNPNGYITFNTNDTLNIGDKISVENKKHETSLYTISELMINNKNVKQAHCNDRVKIGRMKGNLQIGDNIYKISDKLLSSSVNLDKDCRKKQIYCDISIKKDMPISLTIYDDTGISLNLISDIIPVPAINTPISEERIISQLSKTGNTPFEFKKINVNLDNNLYIQSISNFNDFRRVALSEYEKKLVNSFKRTISFDMPYIQTSKSQKVYSNYKTISILFNTLDLKFDYTNLKNIDRIYIPYKYFIQKSFSDLLLKLSNKYNLYVYMPTINRNFITEKNISNIVSEFKISGFVLSNIGDFELLKKYSDKSFICNYTFNIYNDLTIKELNATVTLSPELNTNDLQTINSSNTELIVYGKTPLMNSNYCLLGKANKCYSSCSKKCMSSNKYFIKDRLGFLFRVIPDNTQTVTTIYNSKTTSISHKDLNINSVRIDILDENIDEIQEIINQVKTGNKLEGKDFTNGNFNRDSI